MRASVAICCASASDALAGSVTAKQDDLATNIPETQIQSCHTHDIRSFCKIAGNDLEHFRSGARGRVLLAREHATPAA
jgi:hypothetical protein